MNTKIFIILLSLICACYVLCNPPPYISGPDIHSCTVPENNDYVHDITYEFYGTAIYYVYDPDIDDYDSGTPINHSDCDVGIGGYAWIGTNGKIKSRWDDDDYFNVDYRYSSSLTAIFTGDGAADKSASMGITVLTTFEGDSMM